MRRRGFCIIQVSIIVLCMVTLSFPVFAQQSQEETFGGNPIHEFSFGKGISFSDLYFVEGVGWPEKFDTPTGILHLFTGDFNGDGWEDLGVNYGGRETSLKILIGRGDGSFEEVPTGSLSSGGRTLGGFPADFNQDGFLDLFTFNYLNTTTCLFWGDGTGGFSHSQQYDAPCGTTLGVSVGDFNEDRFPDLILHCDRSLAVLLNDQEGGFFTQSVFELSEKIEELSSTAIGVVDDFDGDGHLDAALSHFFGKEFSVLFGDGAGGFEIATFPAYLQTVFFVGGDIDEDGDPDLVGWPWTFHPYVVFNDGDRGFSPIRPFSPLSWAEGDFEGDGGLGDLNGDGHLDFAFVYWGTRGRSLTVLEGDGCGHFTTAWLSDIPPKSGGVMATADFDADGLDDLVFGGDDKHITVLLSRAAEPHRTDREEER